MTPPNPNDTPPAATPNPEPASGATLPRLNLQDQPSYWRTKARFQRKELEQTLAELARREEAAGIKRRGNQGSGGKSVQRLNDECNAQDFIDTCEKDVRHCVSTKDWYVWERLRWECDVHECLMMQRACEFSRELCERAQEMPTLSEAKMMAHRGNVLGNYPRLRAMLNIARSDPRVTIPDTSVWDANPHLLGVKNGVVDLRTCQFVPPQREMMVTKTIATSYVEGAPCPKWDAFLEQVLPDPEVRHFLQVSAGYWLTGDTSAQCFWFLYGSGANGKSTFLETLFRLWGEYSQRANAMLTLSLNSREAGIELSSVPGKRLVVGSEVSDGMRLNESLVKDLTGGDTITGRGMYKDTITFRPVAKMVMFGNHRPTISGTDGGMWRRVRLVPFTQVIPEEQRNPRLPHELLAEFPGILNWCLRGLAHYHTHGLPTPPAVHHATETYREDSDPLGEFLEESTQRMEESSERVLLNELYQKYGTWCAESGRKHPLSRQTLRMRLEERGYTSQRTNRGQVIQKLRLKSELDAVLSSEEE